MPRKSPFFIAGQRLNLPRLLGAFFAFGALLMFLSSTAWVFESVENAWQVNACLKAAQGNDALVAGCQQMGKDAFDLYIRDNQFTLTAKQTAMALFNPIASMLFWIVGMTLGFLLYQTGHIILPLRSRTQHPPHKKKK